MLSTHGNDRSRRRPFSCTIGTKPYLSTRGTADGTFSQLKSDKAPMTIMRLGKLAAFTLACALLATSGTASAQQKLVLYTSNENTLNQLASTAFSKETGIEVTVVSAGSGVIVKRIQAEKDRPQGDIIWG